MEILITGADGFIGKNLQLHLAECKDVEVSPAQRSLKSVPLIRGQFKAQPAGEGLVGGINPGFQQEFTDIFVRGASSFTGGASGLGATLLRPVSLAQRA